jgi:hypothetical protein
MIVAGDRNQQRAHADQAPSTPDNARHHKDERNDKSDEEGRQRERG